MVPFELFNIIIEMQIMYKEKLIVFPPLRIHIKPIFNQYLIQIII